MSTLGLLVLGSGCATVVVSPEPYQCPVLTQQILDEYEVLTQDPRVSRLRAYVRETERVCRANAQLLKEIK
jgi:hypothetical protein